MLTGIFYAVALQSMHYEFVITFVTVVKHFTADPLFLLVQNGNTATHGQRCYSLLQP